jgi:hypothetical protein
LGLIFFADVFKLAWGVVFKIFSDFGPFVTCKPQLSHCFCYDSGLLFVMQASAVVGVVA